MRAFENRRWTIAAPIALLAAVLLAVVWLDVTTGGDAEPPPLIGKLGTPVRGTFVPPTATPVGFKPTPRPRPTIAGTATGTREERDDQRRGDALIIIYGFQQIREDEGAFPSTGGNIQSLCIYKEIDQGCKLEDAIGAAPPSDPLGNPNQNGYWYQSDGKTTKIYISFEGDIPAEQRCDTDFVEFEDDPNMICPLIPAR